MNQEETNRRIAIAHTILSQFAGGRNPNAFTFMAGATKLMALESGITFKLKHCEFNTKKINKVTVVLTPTDEYDVTFSRVWGGKEKVISKYERIYFDDLPDIFFKETNLLPFMGY